MTVVAGLCGYRHNDKPPHMGAAVLEAPLGGVRGTRLWQDRVSHKTPEGATGEFVTMSTIQHRRWKPQGRAHRAKLAGLLLPTLAVGDALPTGTSLGHWLGINPSEASRHLHRMLAEAGVTTEVRGRGRCQRVYVVSLQDWRAAA